MKASLLKCSGAVITTVQRDKVHYIFYRLTSDNMRSTAPSQEMGHPGPTRPVYMTMSQGEWY